MSAGIRKLVEDFRIRARGHLSSSVRTFDGEFVLHFDCQNLVESWRARSILTKEAGTVAWISRSVVEGDVFLDVGANIGLYTMMAAKRCGDTGQVIACEPHIGNAFSLMKNCQLNGVSDRVRILVSALSASSGFDDFNYDSLIPGTSMSQFGSTLDDKGQEINPVLAELKYGVQLDDLIASNRIPVPTIVKIDVDGNEELVLEGMESLLTRNRPRSLQVELGPRNMQGVNAILERYGYQSVQRHDTEAGKKKLMSGVNADQVAHNMIFEPA